jgi:ribosomal silencing factor RsfS
MFIAFNNLPHCAPTERHVLCITESYKHLAPTEQSTNNQVQNTVCVLPGLLYLVFVFAPEEQHVYSLETLHKHGAPLERDVKGC